MGSCLKRKKNQENGAISLSSPPPTNNNNNQEIKAKAPKSWETRPKLKKEDYEFKNRENEVLIKKPGFFFPLFFHYLQRKLRLFF